MQPITLLLLPLALLVGFRQADHSIVPSGPPVFVPMKPVFPENPRTQIFEVMASLADDELLVVTERANGEQRTEAFISARRMNANYLVAVLDEGRQGVTLGFPNSEQHFKDVSSPVVRTGGSALRIDLIDSRTQKSRSTFVWSAKIEKMDEFARRHPEFMRPKDKGLLLSWSSLGRFVVAAQR